MKSKLRSDGLYAAIKESLEKDHAITEPSPEFAEFLKQVFPEVKGDKVVDEQQQDDGAGERG